MQKVAQAIRAIFWSKHTVRVLVTLVILFVMANAVLFVVYRAKTYPGTTVGGQNFGSISTGAISQELSKKQLLPSTLQLKFGNETLNVTPKDLGIRADDNVLAPRITARYWLPILNIFKPRHVRVAVSANDDLLNNKLASLTKPHEQAAADARIAVENGLFTLVPARDGKQLDGAKSRQALLQNIAKGEHMITLAVQTQKPTVTDQQVKPTLDTLRTTQQVPVSFIFEGKTAKPSPADIAGWYSDQSGSYVLSDAAIRAFVQKAGTSFGISVANADVATQAARAGLEKQQSVTVTLIAAPKAVKTFTYCIQTKNVDASNVATLRSKLASTYADPRGWSVNGKIAFREVGSGCDFRVWLSSSDQMPTFGAICDSTWSCTVKPNVIINFDRWRYASDAWNAAHGSLDDYRSMVINHETGHLLGFGHKFCGGAGQPAPVMQQQSIDLQGCAFNPWPLASEQQQLLASYGIR